MTSTWTRSIVAAAFLAIYLVWGSTFLAIRYAVETVPPFAMMAYRSTAAGLVLLLGAGVAAWVRPTGRRLLSGREWGHAAVAGVLLFAAGHGALAVAEQRVPSGVAALAMATIPLWLVGLDALRPAGERPSRRAMCGLVVGLGAVGLLAAQSDGSAALPVDVGGLLLLLFSAVSWAAGSLYARHAPRPTSAVMHTGAQLLTGGAALVVISALAGERPLAALGAASPRSLIALGYLVLFGSVVAFTAYTWLLRVSTPARVGTYAFVNPIVAVLLGWTVGGEALTGRMLLVLALVLVGVWLVLTSPPVQLRPRPRMPSLPPPVRADAVHGGSRTDIPCDIP